MEGIKETRKYCRAVRSAIRAQYSRSCYVSRWKHSRVYVAWTCFDVNSRTFSSFEEHRWRPQGFWQNRGVSWTPCPGSQCEGKADLQSNLKGPPSSSGSMRRELFSTAQAAILSALLNSDFLEATETKPCMSARKYTPRLHCTLGPRLLPRAENECLSISDRGVRMPAPWLLQFM